jgi:hypothetical protein
MGNSNIEMTVATEDILQKLAPSIVEIISDNEEQEDSHTLGTGFVVTSSHNRRIQTGKIKFSNIFMNSDNRLKDKATSVAAEQFAIRFPPFGVNWLPRD